MFESKERYGRSWAYTNDEAVCPEGWISVANLAGVIECSMETVRTQCRRAGLVGRKLRRVTVDGRVLLGSMAVFPRAEALEVMLAWDERREVRERAYVERLEVRAAERREKEAEERKRIAEGRALVRAERKRMLAARRAELAREKERRRAARERVRARGGRAK